MRKFSQEDKRGGCIIYTKDNTVMNVHIHSMYILHGSFLENTEHASEVVLCSTEYNVVQR